MDVQTSKRVHRPSVSTKCQQLRMLLHERLKIHLEDFTIVWVTNSACVPVLRDSLCARRIFQVAITSRHAVERFECISIKETARISSGMVGEHSSDESVGTGRNEKP